MIDIFEKCSKRAIQDDLRDQGHCQGRPWRKGRWRNTQGVCQHHGGRQQEGQISAFPTT